MSFEKFIFKFYDHEEQKNTMIIIKIYLNEHNKEWKYDEDEMIKWKHDYINWHAKLKNYVTKFVRLTHFKNDESIKFIKPDGKEFRFIKYKNKTKDNKVNMNKNDYDPILIKCVFSMCKHMMKYSCGNSPKPWTKKYNYDKFKYYYDFKFNKDMLDMEFDVNNFDELCRFTIENNIVTSVSCKNQLQEGGNHKYFKYKNKYINSRK